MAILIWNHYWRRAAFSRLGVFVRFSIKGDEEDKAGDKEEHTAKHAPKAANASDAKADGGDDEQYPTG